MSQNKFDLPSRLDFDKLKTGFELGEISSYDSPRGKSNMEAHVILNMDPEDRKNIAFSYLDVDVSL